MSLSVAFRVDAAGLIGTGHFMRCLTLAEALLRRGASVCFVSRGLPAHLGEMLAERGMACLPLLSEDAQAYAIDELAYAAWLGTSQAHDAHGTAQALAGRTWDWLIVDHYALDRRWETVMRGVAHGIMAIDDLADRHHDCDMLLDQNFYRDMDTRYAGKVPAHARLLLGPGHALLRESFHTLRARLAPRTGRVARILVFFGGVDGRNYTSAAIRALARLGMPGLLVDVVIGVQHPYRADVEAACAVAGFACHVQTSRMAELTAAADLAVSAGGSAAWERCCLGLPALSLCTADNQRQQLDDAAEAGLLYAPSTIGGEDVVELIARHTRSLIENPMLLRHISQRSMAAVDGEGAARVADALLGPTAPGVPDAQPVQLRQARPEDARLVWPWRNAASTRRHFFDPSPVELDDHLRWWSTSLQDTRRALLIGHRAGLPCGVLRFDFQQSGSAVVSLYLDPAMTGQGLGRALMIAGMAWLRQNHPGTQTVSAEILAANEASRKMFQSAGFVEQHAVFVRKV